MAFGQQAGPPASSKQVQQLLGLLEQAGHADFRDARGPLGFTQRQAAGKFTRDEADAFIASLERDQESATAPPPPASPLTATERSLRKLPDSALAAELQRRGWVVMEP
ncbi:MAG: hypothetical protein ACT452_02160 [Microthrixaceae bacterium]